MPRLTNAQFLQRYAFLRLAWQQFRILYSVLPVPRQWHVHAYYQPSRDMSDEALLAHRAVITSQRPNLPAIASRDYMELTAVFRWAAYRAVNDQHFLSLISGFALPETCVVDPRSSRGRQLRVRSIARPEPDVELLAKALIQLADERARKETRRGEAEAERP